MPIVAILGAGPIGASIAHRLCQRGRIGDVLFVDEAVSAAAGKALDIRQSGPVEQFDTRISALADPLAAVGASVIVVADAIARGEWDEEGGSALLLTLARAGSTAPIVFAGPNQLALMERAWRELKMRPTRLIGVAPSAMASAACALAGLELGLADVRVTLVGRPPHLVAAWSSATAGHSLLTDRVAPHRLLSLSASLARLWPPGPHAIASASAPVIEALLFGSRRLHTAATIVDGDLGVRGKAVVLPLEIAVGAVARPVMPSLSPQERTEMMNSIGSGLGT